MRALEHLATKRTQISFDELYKFWLEDLEWLKDRPAECHQIIRESVVRLTLNLVIARHLGFTDADVTPILERGKELAHEYFFGGWWKVDEEDRRNLDKSLSPELRSLIWSGPYLNGVFMSALTGDWEMVRVLSDWVDDSVVPEFQFELASSSIGESITLLASRLREARLSNEVHLISFINAGRSKQAKLMQDVILHLESGDENRFNKAFLAALKHWEKVHVDDCPNMIYWVSIPHSMIRLWALEKGMKISELPPNLDALLVR